MRMMNPSVTVSRLDLWFLELAAARIVFRLLPRGLWNFEGFIELRGGGEDLHGPHGHSPGASLAPKLSSGPKKISKKFRCVWTPFGTDILRSKKQAKSNS